MQKMALGNTYVIKGNHDDYIAQRYLGRNKAKLSGWEKTLSIQEIDWMNRLPLTISLPQRIFGAQSLLRSDPAPGTFSFFPQRAIFTLWLLLATANRPLGLAKILVHIIAVIVLD
jgi:hypothetical protein